ncbi:uncharacterized protein [Centruroides vittatus]
MSRLMLSSEQMEMLVTELQKRPYLAKGKLDGNISKNTLRDGWQEIRDKVNCLADGPLIEVEQLKKRWSQWRSRTKSKAAALRKDILRTGGGKRSTPPLTDLEEKVLSLIGNEEFGLEEENLYELGACTTSSVEPLHNIQNIVPEGNDVEPHREIVEREDLESANSGCRRRRRRHRSSNEDNVTSFIEQSVSNQNSLLTR